MTDTFERSCEHWSEAGRREMEDFYALASVDYRHLAEALDWVDWLRTRQARAGQRPLRVLDVACGSGKFPSALGRYAGVSPGSVGPIDYALLDPSAFSIAETRRVLSAPFVAGEEYETTLQALECPRDHFDVAWAIHALYALPADALEAGLERLVHAAAETGLIAHACRDAHYLRFYRAYLEAFRGGGTPYLAAEEIVAALERLGLSPQVHEIRYENRAPVEQQAQVQGYLQRCLFDDSLDLAQMLADPIIGAYLETCRHEREWRFAQRVLMIFFET
ncbi:methyltransferase domain-containing protein [Thiorhodococcus minor]|uniref:Class I SAM-dependent methyltransferase n=1 Tax=Thiorhodococcus minor TaxID=57489 RepID=A0A6M0JYT0_9GAMM|nr:class I SAM-dependent methyltransferase [Thiorhodococcus minor]NEV62612.1 class I SAM-dependent methyltransferase [Thiorhodococcus minor]